MKINVNTSINELLGLWVKYSHKLFHEQDIAKDELENLKKVNSALEGNGIERLQIFNASEKKYTIHYFKNGGEFKKEFQL